MACINDKLQIIYGDVTAGVAGKDFHYIFSYQKGGLESLVMNKTEWLYRPPVPAYWRATTDNDRGSSFSYRSGMWLGAELFPKCTGFEIHADGERIGYAKAPQNNVCNGSEAAENFKISFIYETNTVPAARTEISYEVNLSGTIRIKARYMGKKGLPELPVFGVRFLIPAKAAGYRYEGLSGETYPDRMAGAAAGIYKVEGLPVTPYLVPQDCGVHMNTKWLEIERTGKESSCLRFAGTDKPFAFSCLPYSAAELENATHQEELPLPRRTVVSILGAVRGVGGIDSWGSDVEESYRLCADKEIEFEFAIESCKTIGA